MNPTLLVEELQRLCIKADEQGFMDKSLFTAIRTIMVTIMRTVNHPLCRTARGVTPIKYRPDDRILVVCVEDVMDTFKTMSRSKGSDYTLLFNQLTRVWGHLVRYKKSVGSLL